MSPSTRALVTVAVASAVAGGVASAAGAQDGTPLESPSLLLLIASVGQIVLAAALIIFIIRRTSTRPCPRCRKRVAKTLDDCPRCGADLRPRRR